MTEPNQLPPAEAPIETDAYRAAVLEKVDVAWGTNVGDQGFADPYEVAARAHDALYQPDSVAAHMDDRARATNADLPDDSLPSRKLRPSAREVLTRPVELATDEAPTVEEFVPVVAEAILQGADVAATVLPGAREQIQLLQENGDRPVIWSAGFPEHQHRKLGKTGLFDAVAIEEITPPVEVTEAHGEPIPVETAIATDKTAPEVVDRIREIAAGAQMVAVDDRVKNLLNFRANLPETRAAIWVQFGAHAQKEMAKLEAGDNPRLAEAIESGAIIPIANIDQLAAKVAELRQQGILTDEEAAVFIDYDDTISDNAKRREMELNAAVDAIFEHGWA